MDGIIRLTDSQRKSALVHFRSGANARISRRAHILHLLDRGWSYREIMDTMFCGSDMVADVRRRFLERGLESALGTVEDVAPSPEWSDTICNRGRRFHSSGLWILSNPMVV
jgi:hypothetical protein